MNRGFLDSEGRINNHRKKTTMDNDTCSTSGSDGILNDATPRVDAAMKVVSPSVVEETVAMKCIVVNTLDVGPNPPLPTHEANSAGNAPGKLSLLCLRANWVNQSGVEVECSILCFTPLRVMGIDVVVLVDSIRAISERFANTALCSMDGLDVMLENGPCVPVTAFSEDGLSAIATKLGTPLILDSYTSDICMQSCGRSSYSRVMIELRADVELKDNIVVAMPKITREGHYTCNVRVEYEWKPPRCSSCKVFGHIHEECPKNIGAGEKKTLKKPSQTSRGVPFGQKMMFKPQKEYRPVLKKYAASSSGNKKKGVEPTIKVSNSNPFDVLNSVDNDVDSGTTLIIEKIGKFKDFLSSGQAILVDKDDNPLKKVEFSGEYESEDEVASDDNDMDCSMAYEKVGFDTQSLLEQWMNSYGNGEYDDDPYNDDMYEGQDLSHELQEEINLCFFCLVSLCTFLLGSSFAHVTGGDVGLTLIPCT
ncbi:retrotransposon protein, putative, ty1-copia subclass [Tanacetum coccineum]